MLATSGVFAASALVLLMIAAIFGGGTGVVCFLMAFALALPWSLLTILHAWAIAHGSGFEVLGAFYVVASAANGLLLGLWYSREEPA